MKKINFLVTTGFILLLCACSPKSAESAPACDSTTVAVDSTMGISSSAATENPNDKTHKFVRTANLHFKVKNVVRTTYNIEDIVGKMGGFVTHTYLNSTVESCQTTRISSDSLLEITKYSVNNSMTIRVPNTKLDTTLKQIAQNIDFLDSRIINADDVSLQMLANSLSIRRSGRNEARMVQAIEQHGRKLNETMDAEQSVSNKQEQADNALISNLSLSDQINFSTIEIDMYQPETVKKEVIADADINSYEPGLFSQIIESLRSGWYFVKVVIVFIFKFWGIILMSVAAYMLIKFLKRRKNK